MYNPYFRGGGAQKRMDGEDVYGHRITVSYPRPCSWEKPQSPFKQNIGTKTTYRTEVPNYQQPILPSNWNSTQTGIGISEMTLPTTNISPLNGFYSSADIQKIEKGNMLYGRGFEQNLMDQFKNQNMMEDEFVPKGFRRIRGTHGNSILKDSTVSEPTINNRIRSNRIDNNSSFHDPTTYNNKPNFVPRDCITFNNFQTGLPLQNNTFEHSFQPIRNYPNNEEVVETNNALTRNNNLQQNVELIVTNIDSSIEPRQMRRILSSLFRKHAQVLNTTLFRQLDGSVAAAVKVASHMDAQVAISQLHRYRIGHKRITIAYANSDGTNPQQLRAQIISLLQDVPGKKLPIFKFRELFETRYLTSISMPELYRLRDICSIIDDPSGRMIALNNDSVSSSSSPDSNLHELIYCLKHNNPDKSKGWAEMEISELPNIRIGLKLFSGKLHILLQSHKGILPLQSFQACYEAVIREPLPIDHTGVPLEHLVTCVAGVDLQQGPAKQIIWSAQTSPEDVTEDGSSYSGLCGSQSPNTPLATQLALFSRELVDLLRTTPNCRVSFNKFIPAYHHHFGRQCRVADYGFTKLAELFESMPHVVQILGEGNKRMITLSHRTQIRRFTGDLVRILKGSASRQINISEFAAAAEKTLGKVWDPVHYGVCDLDDLLSAIPEHIVDITPLTENDAIIALPKRVQTSEEIKRTQQFAIQVIELLRHEPQCAMHFSKFVPAYHHYFNQQCRVADYGFVKLIELFEAIPEIVQIEEKPGEERIIRLTTKEALRILSNQIFQLIVNSSMKGQNGIPMSDIPTHFLREYGYTLRPDGYNCKSIRELLDKIDDSVMIVDNMLMLVDRSVFRTLGLRLWRILMQLPNYCLTSTNLLQNYRSTYNQHYELNQLKQISSVVKITSKNNETFVGLTPLYIFAARAYTILYENNTNNMNLTIFQNLYKQRYGILNPEDANCPTITALINSLPDILLLSSRNRLKQTLSINSQLENVGVPLPESVDSMKVEKVADEKLSTWSYSEINQHNQNSNLESTVQEMLWPTKMYSTARSYSPPKPDTPPSNGATNWNEMWGSPSAANYNLSIPMPISEVNNLPDSPMSLISPARFLLPAYMNSYGEQSILMSPPASALPQPNLLDTETESCDSKSESNNQKSPTTPNRCRRKLRVAAQFKSPISL
ncbi:meiosis regulator and mRNA stability factor 1 isoform X2 [Chrysoperla carnea]|uniref:meiosis regulator and mRNA stability factor 1 isoform X2 n=1 Tax=Chrysoperla carnea TaxID=189513 RepID=UPI001D05C6FD|nr:meiosis regulator and mRNA stability factor 1 isoform X2 [Chrysoperla carnea]